MTEPLKISDFDFDLPKELIAQRPASPRDHARLLVHKRASGEIIDDHFYNLDKYLPESSTLVLNDSKVEKCRLNIDSKEIFILQSLDPNTVRALVRPGKLFRVGKTIELPIGDSTLSVTTTAVDDEGIRTLKLSMSLDDPRLDDYRRTPLPPYIAPDESLASEYQNVYAEPLGSKAAPTAGLHFTDSLLSDLAAHHEMVRLTLHVGMGTFAPVKVDDVSKHVMHSENFSINVSAAKTLNSAKHITAVGTTVVRSLESCGRPFREMSADTSIFITPGYEFTAVDSLITNFHLPRSTLLMLVAAFMGSTSEMIRVYEHAIKAGYRFYSFGDAMLIL